MKTRRTVLIALLTALLVSLVHLAGLNSKPSVAMQPPLLAYLKAGDVWVQSIPGGTTQQLTHGANVSNLAWSASGSWLAYQDQDKQLWIVKPEIEPQAIAADITGYAWAPQGDRLAYTTTTDTTLLEADSQNRTELPGVIATAWSPDAQELAYVSYEWLGTRSSGEPLRGVTLQRVEVATGATHLVLDAGRPASSDLLLAGWSADGENLLIYSNPMFSASLLMDGTALLAVSKQGGTPRVLVEKMLIYPESMDYSRDRQFVVVSKGGDRFGWKNKQIALVSLQTAESTALTDDRLAAIQPAFSPNTQEIAYVAAPVLMQTGGEQAIATLQQRRLWVMNRDGSNRRMLTQDDRYRDERPRWSSDGQHLLFVRLDRQGEASLWTIDASGENLQQVMSGLSYDPSALDHTARLFGSYGYIQWNSFDVVW